MKAKLASLVCALTAPLLAPVAAHAQAFKLLHSFGTGTDGALPGNVGLLNVNGTLYGTTEEGGSLNKGTIFAIDPANGDETVLYAFTGGSDGDGPVGGLLNVGGILYGTTSGQLAGDNGTVFKFDLSTNKETVLHSFSGSDGANPTAALIKVGRFLYGTTAGGGTCSAGTVFKINPATGAESVVHSFCGSSDGASPSADLLDVGGILYGTTYMGGIANQGTVFTVNTKTGAEAVLHSFYGGGGDGRQPLAALINVAGTLYGTTTNGGPSDAGTVFGIDPATGADKSCTPLALAPMADIPEPLCSPSRARSIARHWAAEHPMSGRFSSSIPRAERRPCCTFSAAATVPWSMVQLSRWGAAFMEPPHTAVSITRVRCSA